MLIIRLGAPGLEARYVCYIVPEMNVRDICGADGDNGEYLLELLDKRSTTSPVENFSEDAELIHTSIARHGISHSGANKDGYFRFGNEVDYGYSFELTEESPSEVKKQLDKWVREKKLVTQVHGYLVLERQATLYQGLRVLLADIVEEAESRVEAVNEPKAGKHDEDKAPKGKKKKKKKKKKAKN